MTTPNLPHSLRRREALITLGAGISAAYGFRGLFRPGSAGAASSCVLQKEVTEGPYYLNLGLVRRNIRAGRKGTALTLRFKVINATTCKPIKNAAVEIWHADAAGSYSGVAGNGGNYLRGIQHSDANGDVRFESIFPGWYRGRTPHIHMKVFVSGNEVHTGQVFFAPSIFQAIYRQGVYHSRGTADTVNSGDNIYKQAGARALLTLKRKATSLSSGLNGSLTVGVNPS
jgi:protocatechuate 3,4-dioxygenase beta subunit